MPSENPALDTRLHQAEVRLGQNDVLWKQQHRYNSTYQKLTAALEAGIRNLDLRLTKVEIRLALLCTASAGAGGICGAVASAALIKFLGL